MNKIDANVMTLNGVEYVRKDAVTQSKPVGPYTIVRTQSAGVFAGEIESRNGMEVVMQNAIRLWSWAGACSLSQLAMEGVKKTRECRFAVPVTSITLTQAIELIPCTIEAEANIKAVPSWRQK